MKHLHKRKLVKVRTGCITCKIRKVKCDEGKPACQRCTDSGRKCDGYLGQNETQQVDQQRLVPATREPLIFPLSGVLLYADSDSLSHNICAEQRQWLQYFSLEVGPTLSGFADREFWSTKLPQLSFYEPAIRHAMLAVGSLYASLENRANSNSPINEHGYRFSVKQYNLSIASLQQDLSAESTKLHLPLICCLLYICLECLYGDRSLVLDHLRNGLNMFSSPAFKGMQSSFMASIKPHLEQIFRRLDAQSTLFGEPASSVFGVPSAETISMVPTTFREILEAQKSLDKLISLSLNFVRYHNDRALAGKPRAQSAPLTLDQLRAQLEAWERGLNQLVATSVLHDIDFQNSISQLRIQYYASLVYVSNCLDVRECSYDAFHKEFGNIVRLARTLSESPSNSTNSSPSNQSPCLSVATFSSSIFALDASVIPPLYLTALKCREPTIRREAIRLLDSTPGREGLWDAKLHGRVGRRIMDIEESAMTISQNETATGPSETFPMRLQAQDMIPSQLPEERCRIYDAHIFQKPIGGLRTVTVNFLTAPEGTDQPWVKWSEEIDF